MKKTKKNKLIQNESGMVTTDFMFSFILASMFTCFLFAMCYTFTVIEIVQYISYSATRAALPSNKTFEAQKSRATTKVTQLISNQVLAPLFQNGWFGVTIKDMKLGEDSADFNSTEYKMDPIGGASPVPFYVPAAGVRLNLQVKLLEMNLGPLGKIESDNGNGFALTLGSMMFREPSQQECNDLIKQRYQKILNLDQLYNSIAGPAVQSAVPMEDTGC